MTWSGRPLLDNQADAALWVDRAGERARVADAIAHGLNVAVIGPPGAGATSLVRSLQRSWRGDGTRCVVLDGRGAGTALDVVRTALAALGGPSSAVDLPDAVAGLVMLAERAVVVLDGLPEPAYTHQLFGRLRDELWAAPLNWVVTAHEDERAALLLPPADAFFETVVTLPELSETDARRLIELRAAPGELSADRITQVVGAAGSRQPRALLDTARTAVTRPELLDSLGALRAELTARLEQAGGHAAVLLAAELQHLGGASASDQRLLDRMGWTRPHATRMLRKLESAGLVRSSDLAGGAGRPRKIYSVIDPVL